MKPVAETNALALENCVRRLKEMLGQESVLLEQGGSVTAERGTLEIDVPAGATLWFKQELSSPVAITFEATAVDAGGPNDRVSDINTFCQLTAEAKQLLELSVKRMQLSARAYHRILKLSRTIADLAESDLIEIPHVAEAIQYRPKHQGIM